MTEDIQSSQAKNKTPPNFAFDYKGIKHVDSPLNWGSEDDFKASILEKYRRIAAGLDPVTGEPKHAPAGGAIKPASDLAPKDKDFKEEYRQSALDVENARLKRALAEMQERLATPPAPAPAPPEPAPPRVEPEKPATIGKGTCPGCHKKFKRLDMHVCTAA